MATVRAGAAHARREQPAARPGGRLRGTLRAAWASRDRGGLAHL